MYNHLSSFLLAISAAISSLNIPAILVCDVLLAEFGSGRGDDTGVRRALEAGGNAGGRVEVTRDLRGCGESVREIWEGYEVVQGSGDVGRNDSIAPHSSGVGELARSNMPN